LFGVVGVVGRVERRSGTQGDYAKLTLELEGGERKRVFFAPTDEPEEGLPCLYEFVERGLVREGTRLLFHHRPEDNQWFRWRGYRDRYGLWRRGPAVSVNVDRMVPVYEAVPFCRLKGFITGRLGMREETSERSALGIVRHRILQRHWKLLWDGLSGGESREDALSRARDGTEDFVGVLAKELEMPDLWDEASTTLSTCEEISEEIMDWTGDDGYFCTEYNLLSNRLGLIGRADFVGVRKARLSSGRIIEYKITDNTVNYEHRRSWGSMRALLQAAIYSNLFKEAVKLPEVSAEVWVFDRWTGGRSFQHSCEEGDLEELLKRALWARDEYLYSVSSPYPDLADYGKGKCKRCSFKKVCSRLRHYEPDPFLTTVRDGLDRESEANWRILRPLDDLFEDAVVVPRSRMEYDEDTLRVSIPERMDRVIPSTGSYVRFSPVESTHGWGFGSVRGYEDGKLGISLRDPLTPAVLSRGKVRLDFSVPFDFSDRAKMALTAIEVPEVMTEDSEVIAHLKELRNAVSSATSAQSGVTETSFPDLNTSQEEAARRIMDSKLAVIHGPFGSGKTTVIARSSLELAKGGHRVLVTSYTNNAVDNAMAMIRELAEESGVDLNLVRVGSSRQEEAEGIRMVDTRNFSSEDLNELRNCDVVGSTLISCMSKAFQDAFMDSEGYTKLRYLPFDVCIVDEASQCILPYALIPCLMSRRWVLVGDHKQLEPLVLDAAAARDLNSWFDMAVEDLEETGDVVMLDVQYRCPHEVGSYLSRQFYDSKLRNDERDGGHDHDPIDIDIEDAARTVNGKLRRAGLEASLSGEKLSVVLDPGNHLVFVDTGGRCRERGRRSKSNVGEAVVSSELMGIISEVTDDLLFLSPYQAQNSLVRGMAEDGIRMGTVDSYQGRQADVVVLSLVRSNRNGLLGFLRNVRRLNVAMSRCMKKLIVISDSTTIRMNRADLSARDALMEYIRTAKELGSYVSLAPDREDALKRRKRRKLKLKESLKQG
jgi:hypothetical protein